MLLSKPRSDESESHSLYDKLFLPYRGDASPNLKSELPGDLPYSELHTWTPSSSKHTSALAWLTGPGVYHGLLSYPQDATAVTVSSSPPTCSHTQPLLSKTRTVEVSTSVAVVSAQSPTATTAALAMHLSPKSPSASLSPSFTLCCSTRTVLWLSARSTTKSSLKRRYLSKPTSESLVPLLTSPRRPTGFTQTQASLSSSCAKKIVTFGASTSIVALSTLHSKYAKQAFNEARCSLFRAIVSSQKASTFRPLSATPKLHACF